MNDDWRLRVDVHEEGAARQLTSRLEAFDLAHALGTSFAERVIVSRDGPEVFCYAATREQADAVQTEIGKLAAGQGWHIEFALHRWHPAAERWEDPDAPLPATPAEAAAERAERMEREREESAEQGYPEYEVRVRCASRADASELAERLRGEGYPVVQRDEFVVLGADDEDSANELAAGIRAQAPAGSEVVAEGSVPEVSVSSPYATPFVSPFAVFGGMAGG